LFYSVIALIVLSAPTILFIKKFPLDVQKRAATKAFFLWVITSSPIIVDILQNKPTKGVALADDLQIQVFSTVTISELFVYTAAFLAPLLYVVFDILERMRRKEMKKDIDAILNHTRGMSWIFLWAFIILFLTLQAYVSAKTAPSDFPLTNLAVLVGNSGFVVYLSAFFIWYSVILWETDPDFSFEKQMKKKEAEFAKRYADSKGQDQ
jgi:hypothetical protein